MKIAILADAHGNATALQSVILDAKKHNVDKWILAGDMVMKGPSPDTVLELLEEIKNDTLANVIGNHEPIYDFRNEPYEVHPKFTSGGIYSLYDEQFLSKNQITDLLSLPLMQQITVEGMSIDIFHAMPTCSWDSRATFMADQKVMDQMLEYSKSQLAIFAHIHVQMSRITSDGRRIINPGSIGLSGFFGGNKEALADYAIITIDNGRIVSIEFKSIPYDVARELAIAKKRNLPYYDLYASQISTCAGSFSTERIAEENKRMGYDAIVDAFFEKK